CQRLAAALPSYVSYPGQPEFEARQSLFYSNTQSSLIPTCRVHPQNSLQVSTVMKVAIRNECKFAVVSGGHMSWDASNIGPEGISIDLSALNKIKLHGDNSTVSIGPGSRWGAVYQYLIDRGLIVVGGRASDVGVGGFLTGGGISFLSYVHGWGASNILGYEVVLANGDVIEAGAANHGDLYKALKFGSTNYGVITRFDLKTYETGDIWGGARFHPYEDARPLLDHLAEMTLSLKDTPTAFSAVGLAYSDKMRGYMLWSPIISVAGPQPWPDALSSLKPIGTPLMDTTVFSIAHIFIISLLIKAGFPGGKRTMWFALNVRVNANLVWDMFEKGKAIFVPILDKVPGIEWNLVAQPIPSVMIRQSQRNGGDLSGLREADGDQWLLLGAAFWNDASDDAIVKGMLNRYQGLCEGMADERGMLFPFIYPNYASPLQDVMGSFGKENVAIMKEIQGLYDPEGQLQKFWKGGFRL
ncbi:hypothetical protein DL96DRAFT_1458470, partial [Flagelloscypha sp. PMI_526]